MSHLKYSETKKRIVIVHDEPISLSDKEQDVTEDFLKIAVRVMMDKYEGNAVEKLERVTQLLQDEVKTRAYTFYLRDYKANITTAVLDEAVLYANRIWLQYVSEKKLH